MIVLTHAAWRRKLCPCGTSSSGIINGSCSSLDTQTSAAQSQSPETYETFRKKPWHVLFTFNIFSCRLWCFHSKEITIEQCRGTGGWASLSGPGVKVLFSQQITPFEVTKLKRDRDSHSKLILGSDKCHCSVSWCWTLFILSNVSQQNCHCHCLMSHSLHCHLNAILFFPHKPLRLKPFALETHTN